MGRRSWLTPAILLSACTGSAIAQPVDKGEFAVQVARGSQHYIREIAKYQFDSRVAMVSHPPGQEVYRSTTRARQRGDSNLLVVVDETLAVESLKTTAERRERVRGINSRYAFELDKPAGKSWVVTWFHDLSTGPLPPRFTNLNRDHVIRQMSPYWIGDDHWLPELLTWPSFQMTSLVRKPTPDGERVTFNYTYHDEKSPEMKYAGSAEVDPARTWVVTKDEVRCMLKGTTRTESRTNAFTPSPDGLPLLTGWKGGKHTTVPSQAHLRGEISYNQDLAREEADIKEFTLTAFGLPEPPGVKWTKPTPRYLWVLAGAVVFGLLAVLFRRLGRKPARSPATPGNA